MNELPTYSSLLCQALQPKRLVLYDGEGHEVHSISQRAVHMPPLSSRPMPLLPSRASIALVFRNRDPSTAARYRGVALDA